MKTEELPKHLDEFKRSLRQEINDRIQEFTTKTGLGVKSIDITMVEVTSMSDEVSRFTLGYVNIDLAI